MDELSNFTLKNGFHATIIAALEASVDLTLQNTLILSDYPLIDEMDAPLNCCVLLIAAMIGCDTLSSGIPGIGAKRLHALIDEKKPIDGNALIDIVIAAKKGRVSDAKLRFVVDVMMYEPCNTIELSTEEEAAGCSNYQDSIPYMFPPHESFDKYLGGFALPRFMTLEEDVTLMFSWLRDNYGAKRVILWDDTNINIPAASDAHLNRHTYAACYAGSVAKGDVFLQLCGWMGT